MASDEQYKGSTPDNYEQKCPLVLVLDVSYSMQGNAIAQLNKGLQGFKEQIQNDAIASSRLDLCIVTFSDDAEVIQDFDLISNIDMPHLEVKSSTALVDGVNQGISQLEARKQWYKSTGQTYYRPYLVLMTDGYPNSDQDIPKLASDLDSLVNDKRLNFWAFAVGDDIDMSFLQERLAPKGSLVQKLKGVNFVSFFQWLSASMSTIAGSNDGDNIDIKPKTEADDPFQMTI